MHYLATYKPQLFIATTALTVLLYGPGVLGNLVSYEQQIEALRMCLMDDETKLTQALKKAALTLDPIRDKKPPLIETLPVIQYYANEVVDETAA